MKFRILNWKRDWKRKRKRKWLVRDFEWDKLLRKINLKYEKRLSDLSNRKSKRKKKERQTFDLWFDESHLKQVLLSLHHWNHFEKSLTNRNKNETKKKNIALEKTNGKYEYLDRSRW